MTELSDFELLELATPYALDVMSEYERTEIDRRVARASVVVANAFHEEIRALHETMAVISVVTALEPPPALRSELLAALSLQPDRGFRWRPALMAAAAAVIVGVGGIGVGLALRPPAAPLTAAQVLSGPDLHSVSQRIPAGGTATVVFSSNGAGLLVMDNMAPPAPGTVYELWLLGDKGATAAGTVDSAAMRPTTTAILPDLANSTALAFTVEPGSGSVQPTGPIFAQLPLT